MRVPAPPDRLRRVKLSADGPVISTWSSLSRHSIASMPPSSTISTLRSGETAALRRDSCGTGPRAAGPRDADAALPHPHAQPRRVTIDADELDIGAGRKHRMVFDLGAQPRDRRAFGIFHEQDAMGIADRDRRRRQRRAIDRQHESLGVDFMRQRNLAPAQMRLADIDRDVAAAGIRAIQQPARRVDAHALACPSLPSAPAPRSARHCRRIPLRRRRHCRCA